MVGGHTAFDSMAQRPTDPALVPLVNYIDTLVEPHRSLFLHELKLFLATHALDERPSVSAKPRHRQLMRQR